MNSFVDVMTNKETKTLQYHPNTVVLARNRAEVSRISNDLELTVIPNPVNSTSIIEYYLPDNTNTKIELYSLTGELIKSLLDQDMMSGKHKIALDITDIQSGVYNLQLFANGQTANEMIIIIK
jgi:hypothetical protein